MAKDNLEKLLKLTEASQLTNQQIIEAIYEFYGYNVLNSEYTELLLINLASLTGDPETFNPEKTRIIGYKNTSFILGLIKKGYLEEISFLQELDNIYKGKIITQDFLWFLGDKYDIEEIKFKSIDSVIRDWEIRMS